MWSAEIRTPFSGSCRHAISGAWPGPIRTCQVRSSVRITSPLRDWPEGRGQGDHDAAVARPLRLQAPQVLRRRARYPLQVEEARRQRGRVIQQQARPLPLAAGHEEGGVPLDADPTGEADVIGMEMGDQDARDRPSPEALREDLSPGGPRRLVVEAGVHQQPAVAVRDQSAMDV